MVAEMAADRAAMRVEMQQLREWVSTSAQGPSISLSSVLAPTLPDPLPPSQASTTNEACRHSALLADVRPASSSGSTSTQGSQPVATLLYTLTALMARFWPKTLPTSDDASHCLDSGAAPEDLLGKVDAAKATNITELSSLVTLGTAPSSVPLTHKGDAVLSNGLTSSGSFLLG